MGKVLNLPRLGQEVIAACAACGRLRHLGKRRRIGNPSCKGCGTHSLVVLQNQEVLLAAYIIGGYAAIGSDMIKERWLKAMLVAGEGAQDALQGVDLALNGFDDTV